VTFTPTDTANYSTVTSNVSVTVNSTSAGLQFASYYNDSYQFMTSAPTLTIMGTGLDQATRGFTLVNTTPLMGQFMLPIINLTSTQVTLGLPTSMPSGTYYLIYDYMGANEKVLGYLSTATFGGGTGGGGMGPASVQTAAASAQPSLTTSSGSGGIQTMSLGSSSPSVLFSYSRPSGGSMSNGRYVVGGLQYEVQQGESLGSWTSINAQEVSQASLGNGWERVTVRVPASGARVFMRVKVSD